MLFTAIFLVFLITVFAFYFLPRLLTKPRPSAHIEPDIAPFPDGFLWASGEDAYQHEGGNSNADWYKWELSEPRPFKDGSVSGICADFWNRWEEDFTQAADDGHNSHRIGIEWSRVEPEEGVWDEEAWTRYSKMIDSMRSKGFVVFVNLWHFTLPAWAAARGGWLDEGVFTRWEAYVRECARRFGGRVDYWSTMIDAQIYVLRGWFLGDLPPCGKNPSEGLRVMKRLLDAHAAAYRIIRTMAKRSENQAPPSIGMIYFFSIFESAGNPLDRFVCSQLDTVFNRNIPDALHSGVLDVRIAAGPSLKIHEPAWKGTLDWLGVNYYYREIVTFSPLEVGFVRRTPGPGKERTDMDWEIYPEGLYRLCVDLSRRYPGIPLMIAESGMADADDSRRPRMILDHIAWTKRLVDEGYPVIGYTYWSLTDNLEWTEGFTPKFGLYRVDRNTMERTETRSARVFRFIARNNRLPTPEEY